MVPEVLARPRRATPPKPTPPPSATALAEAASADADARPRQVLLWSITVYPGAAPRIVIAGTAAGGGAWQVVSGIDFGLLRGLRDFETKRAH